MNKKGLGFWDLLLWLGAILILGWALLKALGIIHSYVWMQMIPYFGVGVSLLGGAYKLGKIMEGINYTKREVGELIGTCEGFRKVEHEHNLWKEGKFKVHN